MLFALMNNDKVCKRGRVFEISRLELEYMTEVLRS